MIYCIRVFEYDILCLVCGLFVTDMCLKMILLYEKVISRHIVMCGYVYVLRL